MRSRVGFAAISRLRGVGSLWEHPGLQISNRLQFCEVLCSGSKDKDAVRSSSQMKDLFVTFVLGGPGSGKGTQCAKIVETFKFTHLSAGDLLRKEIASNSKYGLMISDMIKEGNIVPSEVTIKLLQDAMKSSQNNKFLIDGFPRNDENRIAYEKIIGIEPKFILYFECPEDEMVKRVLGRNQGRIDDNAETVKKRLEVFSNSIPVINYYSKWGKVHRIPAVGTVDEVFEKVRPLFASCS